MSEARTVGGMRDWFAPAGLAVTLGAVGWALAAWRGEDWGLSFAAGCLLGCLPTWMGLWVGGRVGAADPVGPLKVTAARFAAMLVVCGVAALALPEPFAVTPALTGLAVTHLGLLARETRRSLRPNRNRS